MELITKDPSGSLHAGTRWTQKFSTSKVVRIIGGMLPSPDVPGDDLVIWTTEKDGVVNPRPLSGRRSAFYRWEPARPPRFERDHLYRSLEHTFDESASSATYLVLHVFEKEVEGTELQVIVLKNGWEVIYLDQSDRDRFEDITGKHRGSDCGKANCIVCGTTARKGER